MEYPIYQNIFCDKSAIQLSGLYINSKEIHVHLAAVEQTNMETLDELTKHVSTYKKNHYYQIIRNENLFIFELTPF